MRKATCRICGYCGNQPPVLQDYRILGRTWDLVRCQYCGLVSTDPMPEDQVLALKYADNYWAAADDASAAMVYKLRMKGFARRLRRMVQTGDRALDVGAGTGLWVNVLRSSGFDAFGVDPYAVEIPGGFVFRCFLQEAPFSKKSFDLITYMHVLEHMKDPVGAIRVADRFLKPGGLLAIEVPNIDSLGFKLFKDRWFPLDDIPSHISHFSRKSLLFALQKSGKYTLLRQSGFSLKDSPSILVNTIFPHLSPRAVRKRFEGRHPLPFKILYLLLQMAFLPVAWTAALAGRGEVVRVVLKKNE